MKDPIWKIQIPISTNDPNPMALVYRENHKDERYMVIDGALLSWFPRGAFKVYIYAHVVPGGLKITGKAPEQDW